MKKIFVTIFSIILMVSLVGCKTTVDTDYNNDDLFDKFIIIETRHNADYGTLYTVYDKDTMVEYYIMLAGYKGAISPVYNTDGSIKVYSEN